MWVRGLCEAYMAEGILNSRKDLVQQGRLSLIILDSTVEIALKDYLAHESPDPLGDDKLRELFVNRIKVYDKAQKTLGLPDEFWRKMKYFYQLRCELIHKRSASDVHPEDIDNFRRAVQLGVTFPK